MNLYSKHYLPILSSRVDQKYGVLRDIGPCILPPVLDGSGWACPPLSKKATTRPKSINFEHEIMEIGLIGSNLIEKATTRDILGRTLLLGQTKLFISQLLLVHCWRDLTN
jgi:hypothetical protein